MPPIIVRQIICTGVLVSAVPGLCLYLQQIGSAEDTTFLFDPPTAVVAFDTDVVGGERRDTELLLKVWYLRDLLSF